MLSPLSTSKHALILQCHLFWEGHNSYPHGNRAFCRMDFLNTGGSAVMTTELQLSVTEVLIPMLFAVYMRTREMARHPGSTPWKAGSTSVSAARQDPD